MRLNDDFSVRTLVHAGRADWVPSPTAGVERRMLYRVGEEKARATSIVRYAPHSRFPYHRHPGGEEFLVLEGTFQDETGDFPPGSYVRNPPGSGHAPGSERGCTIFVKLWQFREDDLAHVVHRGGAAASDALPRDAGGVETLFESAHEHVGLAQWPPGAPVEPDTSRGLELLVLAGSLDCGSAQLEPLTWVRLPAGERLAGRAGREGVRFWFKAAPLQHERLCALVP